MWTVSYVQGPRNPGRHWWGECRGRGREWSKGLHLFRGVEGAEMTTSTLTPGGFYTSSDFGVMDTYPGMTLCPRNVYSKSILLRYDLIPPGVWVTDPRNILLHSNVSLCVLFRSTPTSVSNLSTQMPRFLPVDTNRWWSLILLRPFLGRDL